MHTIKLPSRPHRLQKGTALLITGSLVLKGVDYPWVSVISIGMPFVLCLKTTHVINILLPGGTSVTSVKRIKGSRGLTAKQGKPNVKEGTGGKRQAEGDYIYRRLANTEGGGKRED